MSMLFPLGHKKRINNMVKTQKSTSRHTLNVSFPAWFSHPPQCHTHHSTEFLGSLNVGVRFSATTELLHNMQHQIKLQECK